ncbi:MAG: hypothetical protein JNJ58_10170 [Chitinophagaceae bacterium]|nr:hypothetical protein [Chitinophagaceae bacterium]
MKKIKIVVVITLLSAVTTFGQTVKGVIDITNARPNMYLYGHFSSSIFQYFYDIDKWTIPKYEIPNEVDLIKLTEEFKKNVSQDFLENKCFFNEKENLKYEKNKVWIEKTVYTYNLKTKKITYLYQILIEFEGLKPGTESASYKIKNITYRTKAEIIKRDSYVKSLKYDFSIFDEMPPPMKELNK